MMNNKIQRLTLLLVTLLMTTSLWAFEVKVNTSGVTAKKGGSVITESTDVLAGEKITLEITSAEGKYLSQLVVEPFANAGEADAPRRSPEILGSITVKTITEYYEYEFTMPNADVEVTATFTDCIDISSATITLAESSRTFDWLPHTPTINSVKVGDDVLTEGSDYTVSGIDSYTNAGTYHVTITGKGKYKSSKTEDYTIQQLSISTATIELSGNSFVYDHTQHKPSISNVYLNGQKLYFDHDYTSITYSDNTTGGSTNAGDYTITVTGMGNFTGTCQTTYTISKKHISACSITTPNGTSFIYSGEAKTLSVSITDGGYTLVSGTDYTLSGHIQTNVGAYTATITAKEVNYTGTASVSYTINASNDGYYICSIADQTFTGSSIEPDQYTTSLVIVKKLVGTEPASSDPVLGSGAYYLVYNNNINVGTAMVTAIGKDGYNFMASQTFEIVPKSISGATISLSGFTNTTDNSFTYNGSVQRPSVTVHDGDRNIDLRESIDYTLSDGAVNAGTTHTVMVTGKGNYTGSKVSGNYTINKLSLSTAEVTLGTTSYVYDGEAKVPNVQQVKVGTVVVPTADYTVVYGSNTNAGTATVTINPSTTANLSDSKVKNFTISPKPVSDLTITLDETTFTYDGTVKTPTVTVKDGGILDGENPKTLIAGTDYTLKYDGADAATSSAVGSYTITIKGKGNYSGEINKTYVINYGTSDSDFTVTITGTYIYNGSAHTPSGAAVVVKKGTTTTLTAGTDYTLSYRDNINAGTATVTATGTGNYQFVQTGTFTIGPKEIVTGMAALSGTDFVTSSQSFVYNGATQKPNVTVTDAELNKTLVEGTDYTLVNDGGKNVGNYSATITGIGNYTTGVSGLAKNYTITQLSLTGATITLDPLQSYVYDGTEKRPGVQQVKVGNVIVPAADYAVTYPKDADPTTDDNDNVNAGVNTAKVYINPSTTGNLSGSKTQNFSITKKPLTSEMITLSSTETDWQSNSFVYNGTLRTPTVMVSDIPTGFTSSIIAASDYTITNEGGTAVGVYYVTVTATTEGNYSGTIKVPYSIVSDNSETDVDVALDAGDNLTYTGNPITRTITVTKGSVLTEGIDYEVIYNNNTNVGQATITILGKGNYHFVKYAYFNITQRTLEAQSATVTDNYTTITISKNSFEYNGSVQKPDVTVKYTYTKTGETTPTTITLKEGTDYTLSNPGATNVGTGYKAVVSGIGNFTGTMDSPTYEITAKALTDAVITLYPLANPVYDGTAKEPAVQKVTVGGQVYTSGYTVSYSNNINVGTTMTKPTVTVSSDGTSTFSGFASTTFTIQPKPLTDDMVVLNTTIYTYDGNPKEPTATVTDTALPSTFTSKELTQDKDYTITWTSGHTVPGEYVATIQGKGNYTGSVTKPYVIHAIDGNDDVTITLTDEPEGGYEYDGNEKKPTVQVKKGSPGSEVILTPSTATVAGDYTVAYSDNKNAGTATITVTGKGNYDFTQTKTFSIAKKAMTNDMVTLTPTAFTYNGNIQKPTVTVSDGTPSIITANDYTISNEGNINAGDYTVTVTATTTGNYSGSGSQQYTINPLSLDNASTSITLSANSFVYDASPREPEVLLVKVGDLVVPSASYSVGYSDDHTNVGSPQVTVTANSSSNFKDAKSQSYSITKRTITSDMVKLNTTNFTYNGAVQKPTVQAVSGYTITSNDIDVVYPESKDVGVYTVVVTGKAPNNQGTVNLSYSIASNNQSDVNITMAGTDDLTYTGNPVTRTITVTKGSGADAINLTAGTDYDVIYNNNVNKGTATVNVIGKGGYDFVETKTYEIAARPMTTAYGITINLSATSFEYNGSVQKPNVTVTYTYIKTGETTPTVVTLVEGTDYTLNNPGAVNVSTGNKATITGIGNFTGTMDSPIYAITAKSLEGAVITLYPLTDPVYDGTAKEPAVQKVTVGGQVYTSGYTVSYSNNVDVETATVKPTVTVSSDGTSFSGTASTTFVIQPKPLADDMVVLSYTSTDYDGTPKEPIATVTDAALPSSFASKVLTKDKDYTVSYTYDHTTPGEKAATIAGIGNYTGSVSKVYTIKGASDVTITLPDETYTYDGTEHKPVVTVKKGDNTLTLNTDYTTEYSNNVNAGTNSASVIVKGKGNYDFTQTKTFTIAKRAMTDGMVTLENGPFTYNGNIQKPTVTVTDGTPSIITTNDYTISNDGNINAGTYTVTVTATTAGNYSGSGSQQYTINPLSISTAEVNLSYNSIVYNGGVQKANVQTVYASGHQLSAATDYTVSWPDADYTNQGVKSVKVTGSGNYKDDRTVNYTIAPKDVTSNMIVLANENLLFTGNPQKPTVTIEDYVGTTNIITNNDYTLANDEHTAVGTYVVTLTGKNNFKGTATKQYSIIEQGAAGFTVADIAPVVYQGSAWEPALTVIDGNGRALTKNTDYAVSWSNNINVGTATATVTGINGYSGTTSKDFQITPRSLIQTDGSITFVLNPASIFYNGMTQKPSVVVKDGAKELVLDTDYSLNNDGGVAIGTYEVKVTGKGNYKDYLTQNFTITGQSLAGASVVLYSLSDYTYDGNEKKPGVSEVKLGSTVIPADNYTVSYSSNINVGEATVTVTGKGNCSGTASTTFTITPKTVNSDMITISPTTFNYDGTLHKPTTVTVKNGTLPMVEGTDYTLTNDGGIGIGSYSVTITGKVNYTGTASKSYAIVANDANGFTVDAIADQTYTGAALTPVPVVKEGDTQLAATYYDVAYLNNINAGTAVVTVTGKNGYTFVKSQTFVILPKPLAADMLALSTNSFEFNGTVQKPTPTMTDKNAAGQSLITSNDYVVTNEGGTDVGTYHVVITGQNNYTGTIDKTFDITQKSLLTATITLATLSSYVYDGTAKTPAVQLVKVGELVVPATAYDVAYSSNVNVGTATVSVTAKAASNFKDGNTTTFNIERKDVTSDMIYLSSENLEYTGALQMPEVTVKDGTKTLALTTDYTLTNPGGTATGTYEVTITGQGNYKGTAKKQYSIVAQGSNGFSVDEISGTFVYKGAAWEPEVTVKKAGTTTVLTKETDYTVAYTNNVNVGTATVTITGKGNYAGTQSKTFQITPKSLTDGMVELSATVFTYSGSEQRPSVSVTDTDLNVQLTNDVHYNVIYPADMISQGVKTITVRGLGNYTGEIAKSYTIGVLSLNDAAVSLNELSSYVYDGTPKKPTVREVTVGALSVPPSGYTVSYPDDITNQGVKTITVTGQGNYTGSTTRNYTVTPKTLSSDMILLSEENLICTGENIKPEVTVRDGGTTLVEGKDYTLTNDGGTPVGTYYVYITGKGNYTGNASRAYNIIAQGSSVFTVSTISSTVYNGQEQRPAVTVVDNSTTPAITLTENTHYTVNYSNNRNVGAATVTVTGIGAYSGNVTRTFAITHRLLTDDMVALSETNFTYNAIAQRPEVTVTDVLDGISIITDNDYTVMNNGSINANPGIEVKVVGRGNYAGTVTKTYAINPLSIEGATVTLYQRQSDEYNGQEQKPGVREIIAGTGSNSVVVPTTGYHVDSYVNNMNVGTATVTLSGQGNFTGSTQTTFNITRRPLTASMIALSSETFTYDGSVQKPTVTVSDLVDETDIIHSTDYTITNDGGTEVGDYVVTVSATTAGNYSGSAQRTFSIVTQGTATFNIGLAATSYVYDGSPKEPAVTITDGGATLSNTSFDISYKDNVNVGTATVTVTGKGNYAGTKSVTFQITPRPLTAEMITLSETEFVFNSLLQHPDVTVADGERMTPADYTITNAGGIHVGTYHVIVDGKGNYTGQVDKEFTISELSLEEAVVTLYQLPSYAYDGMPKQPMVHEVIVGDIAVPSTGYTVGYGENTNVGEATVTVTGQGDFMDSHTVTFQVVERAITAEMVTLSNDEYIFNGTVQRPEVIVRDDEMTLTEDVDYTLVNEGGSEVGTYQVTVTGEGNYTGTVVKSFVIKTKEAGAFEVLLNTESVVYNGSEQQPSVEVRDGDVTLTAGEHYTVAYSNNINVGMAIVTVHGQGQYEGTQTKTFLITPKELSDDMVVLSDEHFTYNGLLQRPTVTVSDGDAMTANDYSVTNDGAMYAGTYHVTVSGRNNYTGTVTKDYTIGAASLNDAQVVLYQLQSYVYDGTSKTPGVREVLLGSMVVPTNGYSVAMTPNINVGIVTVTVTGQGNYTGEASTIFNIVARTLTADMVTLDKTVFTFNDHNQKPEVTVSDGDIMTEADYTVTNEGGTEEGTYEVIVTGQNNYTGTVTLTYVIEPSDITVDVKPEGGDPEAEDVTLTLGNDENEEGGFNVTGVDIPEADQDKPLGITIPATVTVGDNTYRVTGITKDAFAGVTNLTDLWLPETDEPLNIEEGAIPANTNVHTPLAMLDDYALMPSLADNFVAGKVMTTVTPQNRYWTFSCGVDVCVPQGVEVYIVHERDNTSVTVVQLTDNDLTVGGQALIKANNGVLMAGQAQTDYDLVASARRMVSGTPVRTYDSKDYGPLNLLEPVIEPTHYDAGEYYVLKDNEFRNIRQEGEAARVPACRAVLHLTSISKYAAPTVLDIVVGDGLATDADIDEWYDLGGCRLEGRPTEKGVYIHNNKKTVIK